MTSRHSFYEDYSDFSVTPDSNGMDLLMGLWSVVRLSNIYIGTNKKFELLFHNTKNTKVIHGHFTQIIL